MRGVWIGVKARFFCILIFISVFNAGGQDFVTIYDDFHEQYFGRSLARSGISGINLYQFKNYPTIAVSENDGILTAIIVSSYVKSTLEDLFSDTEQLSYETTTLSIKKRLPSGNIYRYRDIEYGIDFTFKLEGPSSGLMELIDTVYAANSYWHNIVSDLYKKNYAVRIFASEDIPGYTSGKIVFAEALFMAELIGDKHQPLWGMRDGLGMLDNVGYALIREELKNFDDYINYRKLVQNKEELYKFIRRTESMGQDFARNLDAQIRISFSVTKERTAFQLPESLIVSGKGSQFDIALLYYDILRRKSYDCKLALVKKNFNDEISLCVLFMDPDTYLWGAAGDLPVIENIHENIGGSLVELYDTDLSYYILDADKIFDEKLITIPEKDDSWEIARY